MKSFLLVFLLFVGLALVAYPQEKFIAITCGRLIDGKSDNAQEAVTILVQGNLIREVGKNVQVPSGADLIDLSHSTVLPGLIDCHTHVLLQGDVTMQDYDDQVLKESIPYRTIRGSVAAQAALHNGFTSLRDMGTEGAMYADVDIKKAIANGVINGPRMFVCTRALDVTGAYPLLGYSWEYEMPHGLQVVDGVDECRKAVREEIMRGADWIKVYVDRSNYFTDDGKLHGILTFTYDELKAICDEAHKLRRKVAAHAMGCEGIDNALRAGVNSIEHGNGFDDDLIALAKKNGVYWCPTLFVAEYVAEGRAKEGRSIYKQMIQHQREAFRKGVKAGMKVALGSDAGGFPWDVNQALEIKSMVENGMTPIQAIKASTVMAAELLDMTGKLGEISPGAFADIVAVGGDPLHDITQLQQVTFVMKDGRVQRNDLNH